MKNTKPAITKLYLMLGMLCFFMLFVGTSQAAVMAEDIFPPDSSKFSLRLRDTEIKDALRLLASQFNLNLIVSEKVVGKTSLDFDQVSFREAFNAVLKTNELGYILEGNIIRIETLENLEAAELLRADKAKQLEELEHLARDAEQKRKETEKLLAPLVTKTVRLKYLLGKAVDKDQTAQSTCLDDFKNMLKNLLSSREDASVEIIEKTNTLVVTDLVENVDKVIKLAKELDVPTPQIRIEARIVEISDINDLEFGIQWGGRYINAGRDRLIQGTATTNAPGDTDTLIADTGGIGLSGIPLAMNTPAAAGKGIGGILGMTIGKWGQGNRFLDVNLSALEKEDKLKVVSKPSIMVMQNQSAEIHVGQEFPMLKGLSTQSGGGGAQPIADVEYKEIGIKLSITPQITSEDSIFMVVEVEKSSILPEAATLAGQAYDAIDTKNAFTQVVIKNGETLVIGGLYTKAEGKVISGLPYLSKLPYIGCLFGKYQDVTEDKELMIFVTPEIMPVTQTVSAE